MTLQSLPKTLSDSESGAEESHLQERLGHARALALALLPKAGQAPALAPFLDNLYEELIRTRTRARTPNLTRMEIVYAASTTGGNRQSSCVRRASRQALMTLFGRKACITAPSILPPVTSDT